VRYWFVDLPARLVDFVGFGYLLIVATASIVALATAALWALLWAAGPRLP
jgi:hypothetical protein